MKSPRPAAVQRAADGVGATPHPIVPAFRTLLVIIALAFASTTQSAEPTEGNRAEVPGAKAREAVAPKIREIYRDELQAATTAQARTQLVERLLADAASSREDRAAQYLILNLAREQAVEAADTALLHKILSVAALHFTMDEPAWYLEALRGVVDKLRDADGCRRLAEDALPFIDQAVAAGQFDTAEQLLTAAAKLQARARDPQLTRAVGQSRAKLASERRAFGAAEKAAATLAENPDDPAANLARGRYLCFIRGDWDAGLPLLVKTNDGVLAQLAKRSLDAKPETAADRAALAAAWWEEASRSRPNLSRRELFQGAHHWYTLALPGLAGVDYKLADSRIADAEKVIGPVRRTAKIPGNTASLDPSKLPATLTVPLAPEVGLVLRLIQPGKFMMGAPLEEPGRGSNERQHEVSISRPYYIGQYEVTRGQWTTVTDQLAPQDPLQLGRPVNMVSWNDAAAFCARLNASLPGGVRVQGYGFRLPTEAEWEYACRAGTTTATHYGGQLTSTQAWFDGSRPYNGAPPGTKPQQNEVRDVGLFKPNAWGLYDMHGNVQEWCWDWKDSSYKNSASADPLGPATGSMRVLRGGGYRDSGADCRSAKRHAGSPTAVNTDRGFRLVFGPALLIDP